MRRPPRLADWLLTRFASRYVRQDVLGDLHEEYLCHVIRERSALGARLWYWRQVLGTVVGYHAIRGPVAEDGLVRSRRTNQQWETPLPLESMLSDVRFGMRQLSRNPGFSLLAVLTLALGISASTVVFSVVNAVVLRPLPFEDVDELVSIRETTPRGDRFSVSEPTFLDWSATQQSFADIAGFTGGGATLIGDGAPESLAGLRISHSFFPLLGIAPIMGRSFSPDEDLPGAQARVVMISEGLWRRRFGGSTDIVGTNLVFDDGGYTLIGVVATETAFPGNDVFVPLRADPESDRSNHELEIIGRLASGVSMTGATADMQRIAAIIGEAHPATNADWGVQLLSLTETRIGPTLSRLGYFLLAAVGLLLLMACVSVSNLLIARATARQQEIGIRAALGAGRTRIGRQLLTESSLLGLFGGVLGVAVAAWAVPLLRTVGANTVPRLETASIDATVLLVSLLVSFAAVVLFGLVPSLHVARGRLFSPLRTGAVSPSSGRGRLRDTLVVAQIALSVLVLVGTGLMVRSFVQLQRVELGLSHDDVLTFGLVIPPSSYDGEARGDFVHALEDSIARLPGVELVGTTMVRPFAGFRPSNFVAPTDRVPDRVEDFTPISWGAVTPGYFAALDIRLQKGVVWDPLAPAANMEEGEQPGIVIDRLLADQLWPGQDAIGQSLVWNQIGGTTARVIGVVATVRDEAVAVDARPRLYWHYRDMPWVRVSVMVRTSVGPETTVPAIREVVGGLDSNMPIFDVSTFDAMLADNVAVPRFTMQVLAGFAMAALLLAAMGIYGVTAFGVQCRTHEIGIRMALGARSGQMVRMLLTRGVSLTILGLILGTAGAAVLAQLVETLLYETATIDAVAFAGAAVMMGSVAVIASWIPARRAARVDPKTALASE